MRIAKEAMRQEMNEINHETYQRAAAYILEQTTAMHLYILATKFGFGEQRLKRFLEECDHVNGLMMKRDGFLGQSANPDDVKEYMEKKYHLDISIKEIVIEREDNRK